jgi:uncharacterized protein (DUF111 family)
VGAVWALEKLEIEKVFCAPLVLGSGIGKSAHGAIHYPAPAVMEILKNCPVRIVADLGETTTPTGAAILAEVSEFSDSVMMSPVKIGYGAGTRTLSDRPNLLRMTLGAVDDTFLTDRLWLAASDIDNTRPEVFEWLAERMRAAGAVDVTMTDVAMKKGRSGTRVEALCAGPNRRGIAELILSETASLGVRWTEVTRTKLPRHSETIDTEWGPIRVKVTELSNGAKRGVPEYDDCRATAEQSNLPLLTVIERVSQLFAAQNSDNGIHTKKG